MERKPAGLRGLAEMNADQRGLRESLMPAGLAEPLSRGGKPVCWVSRRPLTGAADFNATVVEFFLRALV